MAVQSQNITVSNQRAWRGKLAFLFTQGTMQAK